MLRVWIVNIKKTTEKQLTTIVSQIVIFVILLIKDLRTLIHIIAEISNHLDDSSLVRKFSSFCTLRRTNRQKIVIVLVNARYNTL